MPRDLATLRLIWRTPLGAAVTSMDFVREVGDDWLAVADQGGGLRLIRVDRTKAIDPAEVSDLRPTVPAGDIRDRFSRGAAAHGLAVVYDLAYMPRRTHSPGLVAVGQRTLAFDSNGDLLFDINNPGDMTALAVEAFAGVDGLPVVAIGGKDRDRHADVYLYDGETGVQLHHLRDPNTGAVRAIRALRLEGHLAVVHDSGTSIWDVSQNAAPKRIRMFGRSGSRSATAFYDPQGRSRLAAASAHGIQIWDASLRGPDRPLSGFARDITATAIVAVSSGQGDPQLAVGHGRTVSLWSMTTERSQGDPFKELAGQVSCLAKSPLAGDGSTLLAIADDCGWVWVWELPSVKSTTRQYGRHSRWVNALVSVGSGDSLQIASASDDRTVQLWQPTPGQTGQILQRIGAPLTSPAPDPSHDASVQALAVARASHREHELLISGDEAGCVRVWRMPNGAFEHELTTDGKVRAVATIRGSGGRRFGVAAGAGAQITVWDVDDLHVRTDLPGPFSYPSHADPTLIRALAVKEADQDGCALLAAGDSHGRVTVWETETGKQRWTSNGHNGPVRTLAWVPTLQGMRLASGGSDGRINLWSSDKLEARQFNGHRGPVAALAAVSTPEHQVHTRDGEVHLFISGGADGTIRTWNPDDPESDFPDLPAHPSWVRALLRLEHGGELHVISGGDDGTIRQWVVGEGRLRSTKHGGLLSGFGDRPARYDLLSRDKLQAVLVALLRLPTPPSSSDDEHGDTADVTDEPEAGRGVPTRGPRVVTLQGAWGAGKTSLMHRIYGELRHRDHTCADWHQEHDCTALHEPGSDVAMPFPTKPGADTGPSFTVREAYRLTKKETAQRRGRTDPASSPTRILPVWFNPWSHKSADEVWAGLTREIINAAERPIAGLAEPGSTSTSGPWHRYWLARNLTRLDGAEIRQTLRWRIWQPVLSIPLLSVPPVVVALMRGGLMWPAMIGYLILLGGFVAWCWWRWWRGQARAYLPADLLEGPVLSGPFAATVSPGEPLLRDPLYQARSGYLYLVQHDIKDLIAELERLGYQLVVFIDDLDRCPPHTATEVFEAVNIFLAEDFSSAKFVIGLDPGTVTRLLTEELSAKQSRHWQYPDDPSPGWSFLRKLSQLTVTLPEIREAHTARLMRLHTGLDTPADLAERAESAPDARSLRDRVAKSLGGLPQRVRGIRGSRHDATSSVAASPPASANGPSAAGESQAPSESPEPKAPTDPQPLWFEGDPVIRDHLRTLMALRPHQSVRETKRLLTLWAFYLELLRRLLPVQATSSAQFGRDVLTFAEILTRWPALVPAFGPAASAESGLRDLIEAAHTDSPHQLQWHRALRRLGLDGPEFATPCENLRVLLSRHGNDEVAYLAECVL